MKAFLLFLGDIIALYAALFLTLVIRYGSTFYVQFTDVHFVPFTVVFIPWLLIFYVAGLYDLRRLRNNLDFLKTLALSLVTNAAIAVILFYLIPAFGIAPKTNLVIFIFIFAIIEMLWRRAWNRATASGEAPNRAVLVGDGATASEAELTISENPQLGYEVVAHIPENEASGSPQALAALVRENDANLVIVPRVLKQKRPLAAALYGLFGRGIAVMDLNGFYELVMRKVPLADVEEAWFLENIESTARFYDPFKRAIELLAAIIIGVILLPIEILIALLVKLTSRGPTIYRHTRIGAHGREFMFYKFRTMRQDAERNGAQWAAKRDPRATSFGRFLRASHLDELPQLLNIIKGDLSFVGPRPERPEFVEKLKAQIPFYEVRLLVKPGVTGWAQIHHRADQTLDDVRQKLQYDIYYVKNRSPILDIATILKTLKLLFINPE